MTCIAGIGRSGSVSELNESGLRHRMSQDAAIGAALLLTQRPGLQGHHGKRLLLHLSLAAPRSALELRRVVESVCLFVSG